MAPKTARYVLRPSNNLFVLLYEQVMRYFDFAADSVPGATPCHKFRTGRDKVDGLVPVLDCLRCARQNRTLNGCRGASPPAFP